MEELRRFAVESKTFIFSKVGGNNFRITERNRRLTMFLLLNGSAASWVVKMVGEAIKTRWQSDFFKKQRAGNGILTLQLLRNSRGSYLLLEEFNNGRRRGSLIIPEGVKGSGWEGFAYNLKKAAEHTVVQPDRASRRDGKSVHASKSYAMAVGSAAECSAAMEMKEEATGLYSVDAGTFSDSSEKLGEVEGVFWAVKAQLSGVLEEVSLLMQKVDLGLSMVMGLNKVITSNTAVAMRIPEDTTPILGRDVLGSKEGELVIHGSKEGECLGLVDQSRAIISHDPRPTSPRAESCGIPDGSTMVASVLGGQRPKASFEPFSSVEATSLNTISGSQATKSSPLPQKGPMVTGDHSAPVLVSTSAGSSASGLKLSFPLGPNMGDASDAPNPSLGFSEALSRILETDLEEVENSSVDGSTTDEGLPYGSDLQLVCKEFGADSFATDLYEPGETPSPICSLPPTAPSADPHADWIFQKVKDMSHCLGMSFEGYEDQLQALLIAIKSGQPLLARSVMKKDRELKRLACSINYDAREGSACRGRHKDRVNLGDP